MDRKKKEPRAIVEALQSLERGRERYADYPYLWHLDAIDVIGLKRCQAGWSVTTTIWGEPALSPDPARIALIDTGVADHPNLQGRIDWELAVDFGTHDGGAIYQRNTRAEGAAAPKEAGATRPGEERVDLRVFAGSSAGTSSAGDIANHLVAQLPDLQDEEKPKAKALLSRAIRRRAVRRQVAFQDQRFPSHGTASAGLAVGTPLIENGVFARGSHPYFGVDPVSRIIPIATSPEPEPGQLTMALLYAVAAGADIILMPRGAENPNQPVRPDPREETPASRGPNRPYTRYDALDEGWDLFEAVLVAVSKRIPIVCAAGNSGDSRVEYPASLADADNGIIAVGAVTPIGRRSGYACYGPAMTVVAPSNDDRIYTRYQMRLDPEAPEAIDHNWMIHDYRTARDQAAEADLPYEPYIEYCPEAPLAIDIPGPRGYRSGIASRPTGRSRDDLDALYSLFGGTSAAAAQVGGVLALMCRAARTKRAGTGSPSSETATWNGPTVKDLLRQSTKHDIFGNALTIDCSNASDFGCEKDLLYRKIFGDGLVSARAAVEAVGKLHWRFPSA